LFTVNFRLVSLLVMVVLQECCVMKGRVTCQASPHGVLQKQTTISQSRKPRTGLVRLMVMVVMVGRNWRVGISSTDNVQWFIIFVI